jgi:hypothetical protein
VFICLPVHGAQHQRREALRLWLSWIADKPSSVGLQRDYDGQFNHLIDRAENIENWSQTASDVNSKSGNSVWD